MLTPSGFRALAQTLSLAMLRELHEILKRELDKREGREKFQLP